jgi:hypothetical protein
MMGNKDKIEYFQYEVYNSFSWCFVNYFLSFQLQRYESYADRLRRHFQQLQLDHSLLKTNTNQQQDHSTTGPIEALSGVHNTSQQSFPQHQIFPTRSTSTITYKKITQSPNLTITNPNRYSYMMAVNTHPVAMKEHRL